MKPPPEFWYLVGLGIVGFLVFAGAALYTWAGGSL